MFHSTSNTTSLKSYTIPSGTWVLPTLSAVHMDESIWGDPDKFRPDRFINEGKCHRPDMLVPFGIGKFVRDFIAYTAWLITDIIGGW